MKQEYIIEALMPYEIFEKMQATGFGELERRLRGEVILEEDMYAISASGGFRDYLPVFPFDHTSPSGEKSKGLCFTVSDLMMDKRFSNLDCLLEYANKKCKGIMKCTAAFHVTASDVPDSFSVIKKVTPQEKEFIKKYGRTYF